jgi:histidinol phosphatase-like PHP family hydrolase
VLEGTVHAALNAKIDILAHPGLISDEDCMLAAKKGIFLEISARRGHCLANGHVVKLALKYGARLCINTDAHAPCDIPTPEFLEKVGLGAGLTKKDILKIYQTIENSF